MGRLFLIRHAFLSRIIWKELRNAFRDGYARDREFGSGGVPTVEILAKSSRKCSRQKRDQDSYSAASLMASAIGTNSGATMPLRLPATFWLSTMRMCTTPK